MLRYDRLDASLEQFKNQFSTAGPFPHLVVDEMFDIELIAEAAQHFPNPSDMPERPDRKGVLELTDRQKIHPLLRTVSDDLLSARFVSWLSAVTGIDNLITDPDGRWGLLRQSGDGVEGKIHLAPERNPDNGWYRRLTLIFHFTPELSEDNGGCFQLWDADKRAVRTSIPPLFNLAIVFLNIPTAFHNASRTHLPPGSTRKLMQALYYTESSDGATESADVVGS